MLVFLVFGILFIVGVLLSLRGWRGRRIDDHPICRRCRYDLTGAEGAPNICPECGTDLTAPGRVPIGTTRRRPWSIAFGAILLLIGLGGSGLLLSGQLQSTDWYALMPNWLLRMDAERGADAKATKAYAELLRRLQGGELDASTIENVAEFVLVRQADASATWIDEGALFFEAAYEMGDLDDEAMRHYLRRMVDDAITVSTREKVHASSRLVIKSAHDSLRCSSQFGLSRHAAYISNNRLRIMTDSESFDGMANYARSIFWLDQDAGSQTTSYPLPETTIGSHDLTVFYEFIIRRAIKRDNDEEALLTWNREFTLTYEVVPDDQPLVRVVNDPMLADQIREAIGFDFLADRLLVGNSFYGNSDTVKTLAASGLPINVAFEVFGLHGEREEKLGELCAQANMNHGTKFSKAPLDAFPDADIIDLIFRSNPRIAEKNPDIEEIWGGEIVLEDVPIRRAETEKGDEEEAEADAASRS